MSMLTTKTIFPRFREAKSHTNHYLGGSPLSSGQIMSMKMSLKQPSSGTTDSIANNKRAFHEKSCRLTIKKRKQSCHVISTIKIERAQTSSHHSIRSKSYRVDRSRWTTLLLPLCECVHVAIPRCLELN